MRSLYALHGDWSTRKRVNVGSRSATWGGRWRSHPCSSAAPRQS